MKRKPTTISFTQEELSLFIENFLTRSASNFGVSDLKNQKRHAEKMLKIFRPHLYEAYLTCKEGVEGRAARLRTGVKTPTRLRRNALAIEWLMGALLGKL